MLKTRDLMIMDWVMYNPNVFIEDEYEPSKEWEKTRILNGEDINLADEDCFEPIPLTPKILEKNGWKIKGEVAINNDAIYLYEGCDGNAWWWQYGNVPICPVNFVHTLQHVLRLCGLEELADNIQI